MASPPSPRSLRILVLAALLGSCGGDSTAPDPTVASVDITGTPASPIAVGSSVQLTATVKNAHGDRLGGHSITWLSGDPLIASVSDSGKVTALDGGSALIIASVDGKSGRTTILVSPMGVSALSVTPATPKLYVNATKQLHADVKDARGRVLTGHTVTWQTSDASKATVDGNGIVRGVGAGQVTITAASDGVSGNAIVTVIPPAVTDWSGAADWTTFQGNASHTGYVPVTLDPNAINQRWTVDFHVNFVNPVATGDGKIFVTTSDRRLTVLDEHTGAQKWVYAFGPVDNLNAPAYGDGGVFAQTGGQYTNSYFWGFDANTGAMRFRTHYASQWQTYLAPVVWGQTLVSGGGQFGGAYALSSRSGAQQWFKALDYSENFSPAARDGLAYVYSGSQPRLTVVDIATGAVSFQIDDITGSQYWSGTQEAPALGPMNDAIVAQGTHLVSFDLAARVVKWRVNGAFRGGVAVANGVVYASDGPNIRAIDESSGTELWSWSPGPNATLGSPVATNNVFFVGSQGAVVYAVDLATHAEVWRTAGWLDVAISRDGILLLPQNNGQLVAWDLK
jgi:outer membrane protein assembly factor BamB